MKLMNAEVVGLTSMVLQVESSIHIPTIVSAALALIWTQTPMWLPDTEQVEGKNGVTAGSLLLDESHDLRRRLSPFLACAA